MSRHTEAQEFFAQRDGRIARSVRALRENPHGIDGPLVVRWLVLMLASLEGERSALLAWFESPEYTALAKAP